MATLFEAIDIWGRRVTCDEDWWNLHVVGQRPFMQGWHDQAKRAIENPLAVHRDAVHKDREIFYVARKGREPYLKVVVSFKGNIGTVLTTYLTGKIKPGEVPIWPI